MVQVQGKVNAITLDSCSRSGLVFQDLVSSCEVVNCSSVEVQSTGVMPTIAIDKTDGIVVCSLPTLLCCKCIMFSQYTWDYVSNLFGIHCPIQFARSCCCA